MNYKLNISSLETQVVEVKQFEHNVTTISALFKAEDIHEDLDVLTPCILLSLGDKITKDNGLSYIIAEDVADIGWCVSQEHTQKPGTYFAQFAFIDKDETIKAYTDKFIFKVIPSVDIQKAAFEYKPRLIEAFWNKLVTKVSEMIPTKVSELENDAAYISTTNTLSEYAKTTEVNKTLEGYATSDEVDTKLQSYATTDNVDTKLIDYPTTVTTSAMIASYYKSKHTIMSNKCYIPAEVEETTVNGMTLTPDSTSTYYKTILIDKFTDSTNLKLNDFMLNICTMGNNSTVSADVKLEINTTDGSGTVILKDSDLLTKNDASNVYIAYSKNLGIARMEYTKLRSVESIAPIATKNRYLGIGAPVYIKNVKITFTPTDPTTPTTNFLSGFRVMLSGTKYT